MGSCFKFKKILKFLWKFKNVHFGYLRALSLIKENSHALIIALELSYKYKIYSKI